MVIFFATVTAADTGERYRRGGKRGWRKGGREERKVNEGEKNTEHK